MGHSKRDRVHRCSVPAVALRRRGLEWRLVARAAAATLLLRSVGVGAATFEPGSEADAPTGPTGQVELPQEIGGTGIQWALAPIRHAGTFAFDLRSVRLDDGSRSTQALVYNDIEFGTYVWQPWFIQLRAGVGALADRTGSTGPDAPGSTSTSAALTGRLSMAVFPASRFPFELRAEVSDSRVRGDTLGADYRSHRLSLSQSYRPETGNDSYSVNFDYSRLRASQGGEDTVSSLRGLALREFAEHSFELSGQVTVNDRTETDERSRFANLNARHTFHPASALHVDTLATWNESKLGSGGAASSFDSSSDVRQLSSFATWRPREGEWLYSPNSPLYLTGSVRLIDARSGGSDTEQRARAMNVSLGASQQLTREWQLAGSLSGTVLEPEGGRRSNTAAANVAANYTPEGLSFDEWRYSPSASVNLGANRSSETGQRSTLGVQAAHGVSRSLVLGETDSLSVNVTQSFGAVHDSVRRVWSRALSHSVGLFWQGVSDGASQSYAGLSASDSRTWEQTSGSFQLVNLQLSRRTQLSRHASWSGNLTLQASHSDSTLVDAFSGELRRSGTGWQRFYSGSLSYENQRFLDVARLRFTTLLVVNSQQLESRALGDIDAPRERITESLESRLDYMIGRLETRLSARLARVDGRSVASIFARLQRRY